MFKIFRVRLSDCLYYNFMNILMEPGFLLLFFFFYSVLAWTSDGCWKKLGRREKPFVFPFNARSK